MMYRSGANFGRRIGRVLLTVVALAWPLSAAANDYWQQRTHYTIDADFFPDSNRIVGHLHLRYWNQSPDTLREVYFNLHQNAFRPGSELDLLRRSQKDYDMADLDSAAWGWLDVRSLSVGDLAVPVDPANVRKTVWQLSLPAPLVPGDSLDFKIDFRCQIPRAGFRNGARGQHFDVAQWYPRIAVYDRRGHHAYPLLDNGEFFADFGDYDVTLRAPEQYLIAHTGMLQNESELFPGLPAGSADTILIDILKEPKKDRPAEDSTADADAPEIVALQDSTAAPADSSSGAKADTAKSRTWIMRAENVIDFAWAADPKFRWDRTRTKDGVLIDCFYTPASTEHWQRNGADYTRFCIEFFRERFGAYPYPRFALVAGNIGGGVEYPMLSFMGQRTRATPRYSLFSLTAHEVAHNWFYGLLASDEVAEPFLDEGTADFATVLAHEARFGRWDNNHERSSRLDSWFGDPDDERSSEQRNYLRFRSQIEDEPPLATSAEAWPSGGYYSVLIYNKGATVLFALMDVLGEETFWRGMRRYWDQWHFKHPTERDMFECFEQEAGRNLQWFWEAWYHQNWTLDLALDDLKLVQTAQGTIIRARVKRRGRVAMPATMRVTAAGDRHVDFRLPVEPWLALEVDHTFEFPWPDSLPAEVDGAVIDPDLFLPDLNRTNNYSGAMPLDVCFAPPEFVMPGRRRTLPLDKRSVEHQPRLWYNEQDGVEPGWAGWSSWLGIADRWSATASVGTESGAFDWRIAHDESWEGLSRLWQWGASHEMRDGRWNLELHARRDLDPHSRAEHQLQLAWRLAETRDRLSSYLHAQTPWSEGRRSEVELDYRRPFYFRHHTQRLKARLTGSFVESNFSYQQAALELAGEWQLPALPSFFSRAYLSLQGGRPPLEKRPGLASASAFDYFDDPFYRSRGTLPPRGFSEAHLFLPGGGHMPGYLGQFIYPDNMATLSAAHESELPEFALPRGIPLLSRSLRAISIGAFADGGWIWNNNHTLGEADFLADLGITVSYDIPYGLITRLVGSRPIRAYFPLWISDPLPGDDAVEFRWQIAFSRSW